MITNLLNCGQYVTFSFVGERFFTKYNILLRYSLVKATAVVVLSLIFDKRALVAILILLETRSPAKCVNR